MKESFGLDTLMNDDVLCLWPIDQNLDEFLIKLDNLADTIRFTVEIENNKTRSFWT